MTDNEIIKVLERLSAEDPDGFSADVLEMVNRQKATAEAGKIIAERLLLEAQEALKKWLVRMNENNKTSGVFENVSECVKGEQFFRYMSARYRKKSNLSR